MTSPVAHLVESRMFHSALVSVGEVRCSASCGRGHCLEESPANELVFPLRGAFVRESTRATVFADPGTALLFRCGEAARVDHPLEGGDTCLTLRFAPNVFDEALASIGSPPAPAAIVDGRVHAGLFMLQDRCRGASPETLEMDERALSLLRLTLERLGDSPSARSATARPRTQRRQRELVHRVRAILALRFADPLRLSDIARAAGASPWHLARLFAIHTGTSMHRHRTRLRIHAALRRLADGERDLTTLALDLGFASHAHFSDVFRRECGVPPSRFRERIDRRPHGSCARS